MFKKRTSRILSLVRMYVVTRTRSSRSLNFTAPTRVKKMFLMFVLVTLAGLASLGSAESDVLLKPIKTGEGTVGIVLVQGTSVPSPTHVARKPFKTSSTLRGASNFLELFVRCPWKFTSPSLHQVPRSPWRRTHRSDWQSSRQPLSLCGSPFRRLR